MSRTTLPAHAVRVLPRTGLIAIGGPPFAGRGVLTSMLCDHLVNAIKLETAERLTREVFYPNGPGAPGAPSALPALLAAAAEHLTAPPGRIVILCSRFDTPGARLKAQKCAAKAGVPFLHVEARSTNIRAIRRLYRVVGLGDPREQLQRYDALLKGYEGVDVEEARRLPSLRLSSVLQDPDAASAQIIGRWNALSL